MAEQTAPTDPTQAGTAAPGGESGVTATITTPASPAAISMSREELDRQLAEARRAGERTAKETDEIKQLRASAKRLQEIEEASKSETEKLTERAAKAEALATERASRYQGALKAAAFKLLARDKGIPADRLDDAYRLADLAAIEVDESTDAVKGMDVAVDALIAARPWLKDDAAVTANGTRPAAPNLNAGGQAQPNPTREQRVAQATQELTRRYGSDF